MPNKTNEVLIVLGHEFCANVTDLTTNSVNESINGSSQFRFVIIYVIFPSTFYF